MEHEIDRPIGAVSAVIQLLIYTPTLTYDHEVWVMTKRMRLQIEAAEMVA